MLLNWRFGVPPNYANPINSVAAISQQLKVRPTTALEVVKHFMKHGFKRVREKGGGRKRIIIKDEATEAKLLSDEML